MTSLTKFKGNLASLSLSVVSVENVTLQIEGGYDADGKGPSIWDTWTEVEGAIADGSDGKVACDSYNNYEEDARIISEMGATHDATSEAGVNGILNK